MAALLSANTVTAQTPVLLSARAVHVLDSLASTSRSARVETAACVTGFTADPFVISQLGPASYIAADSVSMHAKSSTGLCAVGVPTVHTHVAKNGILMMPSEIDLASKLRSGAPFALIVAVTDSAWHLVLY